MADCSLCDNTAYRPIDPENRAAGVIPCDHRRNGAGFESVSVILSEAKNLQHLLENAALTPIDRQLGEIIRQHVGRQNAIRGRDLAVKIWPDEMANPAKYESAIRRWLEESIYRLRRFGHLPVAASKANPMGYYIPNTAAEVDEVHDRLFREGIERIVDSQLFRPDRDLRERLMGQLALAGGENRETG